MINVSQKAMKNEAGDPSTQITRQLASRPNGGRRAFAHCYGEGHLSICKPFRNCWLSQQDGQNIDIS